MELELQDDASEANEDAHETLSRLSRTTAASETRRVSDWVNSSPNVPATNQEAETVVTASPATSINNIIVSMPSQHFPNNISQLTFAPVDLNETRSSTTANNYRSVNEFKSHSCCTNLDPSLDSAKLWEYRIFNIGCHSTTTKSTDNHPDPNWKL